MSQPVVCLKCRGPMEVDAASCRPGEIHYKPCPKCGAVGIDTGRREVAWGRKGGKRP